MPRPYDVITFDCYGTLIDWEGGIAGAFAREAASEGVRLDRDAVLREYARVEPIVEGDRYRPYREVLTETAVRVARSLGWAIAYTRGLFLADSLPHWKAFPDTNAALERLRNA
ncbi:MAG TPA: haloacid dehalogenase, partial [Thermoanaerobaculia bacterium]|nr:haloacid dehalogenase [Thermoanaerobaculia bacterium]